MASDVTVETLEQAIGAQVAANVDQATKRAAMEVCMARLLCRTAPPCTGTRQLFVLRCCSARRPPTILSVCVFVLCLALQEFGRRSARTACLLRCSAGATHIVLCRRAAVRQHTVVRSPALPCGSCVAIGTRGVTALAAIGRAASLRAPRSPT